MKTTSFADLYGMSLGLSMGVGLIALFVDMPTNMAAALGVFAGTIVWLAAAIAEPNRGRVAVCGVFVGVLCFLAGAPIPGALFGGILAMFILALYGYLTREPEEDQQTS